MLKGIERINCRNFRKVQEIVRWYIIKDGQDFYKGEFKVVTLDKLNEGEFVHCYTNNDDLLITSGYFRGKNGKLSKLLGKNIYQIDYWYNKEPDLYYFYLDDNYTLMNIEDIMVYKIKLKNGKTRRIESPVVRKLYNNIKLKILVKWEIIKDENIRAFLLENSLSK